MKGVQSNHDYAEPYAKQRACLIDSQDMLLLPSTFCTNNQHSQENLLNCAAKKSLASACQSNNKLAQQLRMVRINSCQNALEQSQQTYATVKRKSSNRTNASSLSQSTNFNQLLNQNNLE